MVQEVVALDGRGSGGVKERVEVLGSAGWRTAAPACGDGWMVGWCTTTPSCPRRRPEVEKEVGGERCVPGLKGIEGDG